MDRLAGLAWGCYGTAVVLLAAVPFVGVATKGARRWIGAGAFTKIMMLRIFRDRPKDADPCFDRSHHRS